MAYLATRWVECLVLGAFLDLDVRGWSFRSAFGFQPEKSGPPPRRPLFKTLPRSSKTELQSSSAVGNHNQPNNYLTHEIWGCSKNPKKGAASGGCANRKATK